MSSHGIADKRATANSPF